MVRVIAFWSYNCCIPMSTPRAKRRIRIISHLRKSCSIWGHVCTIPERHTEHWSQNGAFLSAEKLALSSSRQGVPLADQTLLLHRLFHCQLTSRRLSVSSSPPSSAGSGTTLSPSRCLRPVRNPVQPRPCRAADSETPSSTPKWVSSLSY